MENTVTPTKSAKTKRYSLKKRLPTAILCALAPAVTLFTGIFELYAGNREELEFAFTDVLMGVLLICLALAAVFLAILLPLRGKAFRVASAVVAWLSLMFFLQGTFLNVGVNSLAADGVGMKVHPAWEIGNAVLWLATLCGVLWLVLRLKKKEAREWLKLGVRIVLILVIGAQMIPFAITSFTTDVFAPKSGLAGGRHILTEEGMFEVSSEDNILIFVLDSFDADYVKDVTAEDPDFFQPLDGFTYYQDNLSWYTRTFPAAASMITGVKNDFTTDAATYFDKAYGSSSFLDDLKQNNYRINLFIDDYYAYRDAATLEGFVENVSVVEGGYTVENKGKLMLHLVGVATYRYMPIPVKRVFDLSTESFKGFVKYNGAEYPAYVSDDAVYFDRLEENGLTAVDGQNQYMFIHMEGCHTPYRLDEFGNPTALGTAESTTKGCMRMIYAYMEELKRLGLYEDATIVITGDHPGRFKDYENVPHPTLTALFFKPKGSAGTPLAYSQSPVAQDMLIPSLVASAGMVTEHPYGDTYWDASMEKRSYYFLKNTGTTDYRVVEYEVLGDGRAFENWEIISETDIGFLYE